MKDLLKTALADALVLLDMQTPTTKLLRTDSKSIMNVKPTDLLQFMKDNDIPDDAVFDGIDNGYDGWDDFVLSWDVKVPTTDADKLKFKRKRFRDIAWKEVYNLLLANGYTRGGYCTSHLKQFDDTTVYDMYMAGDFDRLVTYYSLPFKQVGI